MRWATRLAILSLALIVDALVVNASQQQLLTVPASVDQSWSSRPWDERPNEDATGNLIFQSLAGLMQMKANSKHPRGHAIVRTTIPLGTLLYHGRPKTESPAQDWIAFDPEHSIIFARGPNGTLFTFKTTRELTLLYFDGCSANKVEGVVDTQDLLFFGELKHKHQGWWGELERIKDGCAWGKQYGVDGFIRMEFDFEIMYCDFSDGLELVSAVPAISGYLNLPHPPGKPDYVAPPETEPRNSSYDSSRHNSSDPEATFHGLRRTEYQDDSLEAPDSLGLAGLPPLIPPPGWKGTLPFTGWEAKRAGTWHNNFPGELRAHPDPSTLITFFDPSLTSLVEARRSLTRNEYNAGNASREDVARVRADVAEMAAREPGARSGVDWVDLARVIEDRFADRLPYLQYLLHQSVVNASAQAAAVRKQLIVSLVPYMHRGAIGTLEWFADIAHGCAARFTESLPVSKFTKQEYLLYRAVEEVLHEICRVYIGAWVDAFDVEAKDAEVAARLLGKWSGEFDALTEWLDWPVWIQCHPACGVNEYCYVPQGTPWNHMDDHEPRCLPLEDERF
ncbi:uncharacterized protein B0H18DRAFT_1038662 [Fomitopsis serialis]|uniref:uncharacterized protein n=1 Tax=Fomitopsis serialis TaxID=139415 RepID=UPI00200815E1|nr:uncharacterized protein B0H18DRAFT_1038662 [Neoantrodia serialis]KAH9916336.1 hypothetical protein B0H18DRAFT_1038662 [Neoantrodia serialis]